MSEDRFEERLREAAREVRRPPETPRDAIWARIEEARRARRARRATPALDRGWPWGLGLAAMLVLGVAIGRLPLWDGDGTVGPTPTAEAPAAGTRTAYRLVAFQTLSSAEALLTSVRSGSADPQVIAWARDVLSSTRLLLDSPAAQDRRLRSLLEDLELVLVQIAQLSGDDAELDWIREGMEERGVLERLRSMVPGGLALAGS